MENFKAKLDSSNVKAGNEKEVNIDSLFSNNSILIDQVDHLEKIKDKIEYISSTVEDSNSPLSQGLSALLFDISKEVGVIGNKLHEYLKTQQ